MKITLLLLLLLPAWKSFSQAIPQKPTPAAPGPTALSETVCLPTAQARLIAQALQRFEKLKPAYLKQVEATQAWRAVHGQDSAALAGRTAQLTWFQEAYTQETKLRLDATNKQRVSQGKARRRGWLVALETAALALAGYVLLTK